MEVTKPGNKVCFIVERAKLFLILNVCKNELFAFGFFL
jgi:hypothetical protein